MDDIASTLPLPASLGLLLTKEDGRFAVDTTRLDLSLAGATIADLSMRGYIALDDKKVRALKTDTVPGDEILARALALIQAEPKPRPASWWVSKLQGKQLRTAVMSALVSSGALTRADRKVFGLFPATAYPEVNGATEKVLRQQIADVLAETSPPTSTSAALIALLHAVGALRKQFGAVPMQTIKRLTEGGGAAPAVKAVMDEIVIIAAMTATIAASTAATTS
jgi:hypothetical protein